MTATTQRAKSIFMAMVGKMDPDQWSGHLDVECGDDRDLRRRVETLLEAHSDGDSFLAQPAVDVVATLEMPPMPYHVGTTIGPYKLREQIGEGGFGLVYVAEQTTPVRRKVALKVIKLGMDTKEVIARFQAERQALALMDHPNIAHVIDGGATELGRPYFVMELVRGIQITKYCDQHKLDTSQRLKIFVQVCRAVQHAHQKGVIHRDIKPSNVLVADHDGIPVPKVIDFGVAKAINQRLTDQTVYTRFNEMIGTPMYMSPEQAEFSGLDVDTRTDVYSLGILLYELLTGMPPFDKEVFQRASNDEIRRIIREDEPPRPSMRISTLAAEAISTLAQHQGVDQRKLSRQLSGELDWLVMKALEKERNRRYESASAFAADIDRYLNHQPVEACPPSNVYRVRKFVRRNKVALITTAFVATALIVGAGVSVWQARQAEIARRSAEHSQQLSQLQEAEAISEAAKARAVVELLQEMLDSANPDQTKGADYTVRELLDQFSTDLVDQLSDQPEVEAELRTTIGMAFRRLRLWDKARPHLQRALELRRQVYGNEHEKVAHSLVDYASNESSNDPAGGIELARQALAIYRKTGGHPEGSIRAMRVVQLSLQMGLGNYTEANVIAREAVAIARATDNMDLPEVANILHGLAASKTIQGAHSEAVPLAREAVDLHRRVHGAQHPETAYGLTTLGRALSAQGDAAAAEPHYREALAIFRKQFGDHNATLADVMSRLAGVLQAQGKLEQAEAQLRQAIDIYQQLESESPTDIDFPGLRKARQQLVNLLKATGRNEEAEEIRRPVISRTPRTWLDFYERARVYTSLRRHEEALADFNEVIRLNPNPRYQDHFERGRVYTNLGRHEEALADFDEAIRLASKPYWLYHRDRGEVYTALERHEEALADFLRSIELQPTSYSLYKRSGRAHFKLGHYDKALADITKAVELKPVDTSNLIWIPLDELAVCPDERLREGILGLANKTIELTDHSARAYATRGWILSVFDQEEKALADLKTAFDNLPSADESGDLSLSSTCYWLSALCSLLAHRQDAIPYLTKMAELQPEKPTSPYYTALAMLGSGKVGLYRNTCRQALNRIQDTATPTEGYWTAWTCVLGPEAVDDYAPVVRLAEKAVETDPESEAYRKTLGAILYRAGRTAEAVKRLTEANDAMEHPTRKSTSSPAYNWYFLAMVHHSLGHHDEARQWLDRAIEWTDNVLREHEEGTSTVAWNRKLTLELFRNEAETLLGKDAAAKEIQPTEISPPNTEEPANDS